MIYVYMWLKMSYVKMIEEIDMEKRKLYLISMAIDLRKILERIIDEENIVTEKGARYPVSYLIEDMLLWVIRDPKRFKKFLEETYELTEIWRREGEDLSINLREKRREQRRKSEKLENEGWDNGRGEG